MAVISGPAAHAAAQRVARLGSGPKKIGFNGAVSRGGMQTPVSKAPPPAPGAIAPVVRGSVPQPITSRYGRAPTPKRSTAAPVAAKPQTLRQSVMGTVQAGAQAAIQPLKANADTLSAQEAAIAQRLAGYDKMYTGQLQANAANAPAQTAGAVTSAQTVGAQAIGGINGTQDAIARAIQSDPELAGAAAGGGARAMIAQEIAAQRIAQAATNGANTAYAAQIGGNAGQLANTLAGSGIMQAREGQANVANTFSNALGANSQKIQQIAAAVPGQFATEFGKAKQQQFTNQTVIDALGLKKAGAVTDRQRANTAQYVAKTTRSNDAGRLRIAAKTLTARETDNRANRSIASLRIALGRDTLSETQRHHIRTEIADFQRIKAGKTGSGDKVSQRQSAATTRKAATEFNTITGLYHSYKDRKAVPAGATSPTSPAVPAPTVKSVTASLIHQYPGYGAVVPAAVEYAAYGYVSQGTEAKLRAQGINVPKTWTQNRGKSKPLAALPNLAAPAFPGLNG